LSCLLKSLFFARGNKGLIETRGEGQGRNRDFISFETSRADFQGQSLFGAGHIPAGHGCNATHDEKGKPFYERRYDLKA
jgi:hypothetical protein